jgi:beta-lactam-binding protein with PASTA domain
VLKEGRAVRHFVSSGRVGFEVSDYLFDCA